MIELDRVQRQAIVEGQPVRIIDPTGLDEPPLDDE
jgi:hypothetical protein